MIKLFIAAVIFGGSSALLFFLAPKPRWDRSLVEAAYWLGFITVVLVIIILIMGLVDIWELIIPA